MQKTQVWSLFWEDPIGKKVVTDSSILAWEFPWTEEPGGLQSMASQRVGHDLATEQQQQIPPTQFSNFYRKNDIVSIEQYIYRNINNLRYADDITVMAESQEVLKNLLIRVKKESEKNWLETQH